MDNSNKYEEAFESFNKCRKIRAIRCLDCSFTKEHGYTCKSIMKRLVEEKKDKSAVNKS